MSIKVSKVGEVHNISIDNCHYEVLIITNEKGSYISKRDLPKGLNGPVIYRDDIEVCIKFLIGCRDLIDSCQTKKEND